LVEQVVFCLIFTLSSLFIATGEWAKYDKGKPIISSKNCS